MKTIYQIFILFFLLMSLTGFSQNGYEMREGETIFINESGEILNSNMPMESTSKKSPPIVTVSEKPNSSLYYDDGKLKIPGYSPTGIPSTDEENYRIAKENLYYNNPVEFEKWYGNKSSSAKISVRLEEFLKMPEIKQQQILANPEKYYLEDSNTNPVQE